MKEVLSLNFAERIPRDVFIKVLEYVDLGSIYHFSLCNKEMNEFVNTTEHIWKVIYHQLCGEYQERNCPISWKLLVREALQWTFAPPVDRGYTLSNRNRTLHYNHHSWASVCFGKQLTLKEHCGKTICFEIVLDQFLADTPDNLNWYSLIIGVHWKESGLPSSILGNIVSDEIGFSCGNQYVFRLHSLPTQEAVGLYTWPKTMIKSGDVIGVKILIDKSGQFFKIQFFLNGVKRLFQDSAQLLQANKLQPCLSIIHSCVVSIKNSQDPELTNC